jgi:hypothetical protein
LAFLWNQSGALVFEDSVGCAELISCDALAAMITNRVHCVFVSSCFSQDIGNTFLKSGVDFVVCIDRKQKIMDEAASKFAKSFYHALALGTHSVPEAFEAALAALRNSSSHVDSFSLSFLLNDAQSTRVRR